MATLCRKCLRLSYEGAGVCPGCGSKMTVSHGELTTLDIAHIDCDAFFAAVEKRDNPSLRNKPVLIGRDTGRGVVATACYVARRYGPRSAMPMYRALELCPGAVVIPPDMAKYKRVGGRVRSIFLDATPTVEPVSIDEAYLDLTQDERRDPRPPAVLLAEIAARVEREVGITVSVGLSHNKFLAKMASDLEKPRGFSVIGRAEARSFLAPLSVRKIHGVGEATAKRMAEGGVDTIGQLQQMTETELVAQFGKFGRRLAQFAVGEDDRKVTTDRQRKSVSAETTFRSDMRSAEDLCSALRPLCDKVATRLVQGEIAGRTVVVKLKTADFQIHTRNHRMPNPTQRANVIYEHAAPIIAREADGRKYRLIGVGVSDLRPAAEADPPGLFDGLD